MVESNPSSLKWIKFWKKSSITFQLKLFQPVLHRSRTKLRSIDFSIRTIIEDQVNELGDFQTEQTPLEFTIIGNLLCNYLNDMIFCFILDSVLFLVSSCCYCCFCNESAVAYFHSKSSVELAGWECQQTTENLWKNNFPIEHLIGNLFWIMWAVAFGWAHRHYGQSGFCCS